MVHPETWQAGADELQVDMREHADADGDEAFGDASADNMTAGGYPGPFAGACRSPRRPDGA